MRYFPARLTLVAAALLTLSASPVLAGDEGGGGSTGGGSSSGGSSGGSSSGGSSSGGESGKGGATDSSGEKAGVPAASSPSSTSTADAPAANAPSSPPTLGAGEVAHSCPSCPVNHNADKATTAGSHDAVYYSNGTLMDSKTGRAAYFGPDGQSAWSEPQPGTSAFTMPDGRTAYYLPIEGGGGSLPPIVSPPAASGGVSISWPVITPTPAPASGSAPEPTCADIVAGGFTRDDGSCGAATGPVRPS